MLLKENCTLLKEKCINHVQFNTLYVLYDGFFLFSVTGKKVGFFQTMTMIS